MGWDASCSSWSRVCNASIPSGGVGISPPLQVPAVAAGVAVCQHKPFLFCFPVPSLLWPGWEEAGCGGTSLPATSCHHSRTDTPWGPQEAAAHCRGLCCSVPFQAGLSLPCQLCQGCGEGTGRPPGCCCSPSPCCGSPSPTVTEGACTVLGLVLLLPGWPCPGRQDRSLNFRL